MKEFRRRFEELKNKNDIDGLIELYDELSDIRCEIINTTTRTKEMETKLDEIWKLRCDVGDEIEVWD